MSKARFISDTKLSKKINSKLNIFPDVYPQEYKQKEDELTSVNVKQGFLNQTLKDIKDAQKNSQSLHDNNYLKKPTVMANREKIKKSFEKILNNKKNKLGYAIGNGKKRPSINKECFFNLKNRSQFEAVFVELAGSKPLQETRKVPIMVKKDDIFYALAEYKVPLVRATWFIKMQAAYNLVQQEVSKPKKRPNFDPYTEWTQAITRFMREQLQNLNKGNPVPHHAPSGWSPQRSEGLQPGDNVCVVPTMFHQQKHLSRQSVERIVYYVNKLACHMYVEGLLDRHEFLSWVVEEMSQIRLYDVYALSNFSSFVLMYNNEVLQNQLLARKFMFAACHQLRWIFAEDNPSSTGRSQQETYKIAQANEPVTKETEERVSRQLTERCPAPLLNIAQILCTVVKTTVLSCPGAAVWYQPFEPDKLLGSPLDLLPCPPSLLFLNLKESQLSRKEDYLKNRDLHRKCLRCREREIQKRSKAAESKWNEYEDSVAGITIKRVLGTLETLDKSYYYKGETADLLYKQIFLNNNYYDTSDQCDEAIISLLCEWGITEKRSGIHRTFVVVNLLQTREKNIRNYKENLDKSKEKRSSPLFQQLLYNFLDKNAPTLRDPSNKEEVQAFKNLVYLYGELIKHNVFSYEHYINTLVTKGELTPDKIKHKESLPTYEILRYSNKMSSNTRASHQYGASGSGLLGQSKESIQKSRQLDSDIDGAGLGMDTPALDIDVFANETCGSARHFTDALPSVSSEIKQEPSSANKKPSLGGSGGKKGRESELWGYGETRHAQYIMHFPVDTDLDDDEFWNERLMILYGPGKRRSEVMQNVKRTCKFFTKLLKGKRTFDKSSSSKDGMDWEGKWQPSSTNTKKKFIGKFMKMSYFDRRVVTMSASTSLQNMFHSYMVGRSSNLPDMQIVTLLFGMMEESLDIWNLLNTCSVLLAKLATVRKENGGKNKWYLARVTQSVVASLRYYHSCLMLDSNLGKKAFQSGYSVLKAGNYLTTGKLTTSAEKNILFLLYELYPIPKVKQNYPEFEPQFESLKKFITHFGKTKPSSSNCKYSQEIYQEFIRHPNRYDPLEVVDRLEAMAGTQLDLNKNDNRYSFVCSVILAIYEERQDLDRVLSLSLLCAEINTRFPQFGAEWLGVFHTLCTSNNTSYNDVTVDMQIADPGIREPLSLFLTVLITRNCFSIDAFIDNVAMGSILNQNNKSNGNQSPGSGALLTCHMLVRLFRSPNVGLLTEAERGADGGEDDFGQLSAADKHLLGAKHAKLPLGAIIAVLKGMVNLGDVVSTKTSGINYNQSKNYNNDSKPMNTDFWYDFFDDISDNSPGENGRKQVPSSTNSPLSNMKVNVEKVNDFAKQCVKKLCAQRWLSERYLKRSVKGNPLSILQDNKLNSEQRKQLLQHLCYNDQELKDLKSYENNQLAYIVNILSNVNRWNMRKRILELTVMLKQHDQKNIAEIIAKATVEVFKRHQQQVDSNLAEETPQFNMISGSDLDDKCNQWLIAPLICKLDSNVQGTVLNEASHLLEAPQSWNAHNSHHIHASPHHSSQSQTRSGSRSNTNAMATSFDDASMMGGDGFSLLNNHAFLILILNCLKGQEDQRDTLLDSLKSQITMLITEWQCSRGEDAQIMTSQSQNTALHDGLKLRLSLVGGMFDTVENNTTFTSEIVILLTRLISYEMVDVKANEGTLFNTVFDMISMLLHHTLGGIDCNKRDYTNIVKKMKKEMGERQSDGLKKLRKLLPFSRNDNNFVLCFETVGGSSSGNHDSIKTQNFSCPSDPSRGLQISSKVKINPWDLIEGIESPAPMCLSWFGAKKIMKEVPYYEKEHVKLMQQEEEEIHDLAYFLQPPNIPEEEPEEEVQQQQQAPQQKQMFSPSATNLHQIKSGMHPMGRQMAHNDVMNSQVQSMQQQQQLGKRRNTNKQPKRPKKQKFEPPKNVLPNRGLGLHNASIMQPRMGQPYITDPFMKPGMMPGRTYNMPARYNYPGAQTELNKKNVNDKLRLSILNNSKNKRHQYTARTHGTAGMSMPYRAQGSSGQMHANMQMQQGYYQSSPHTNRIMQHNPATQRAYPAVQRGYPQQPGMPNYQGMQKGQGYHGQRITPQPGSYQQPGINPMMTSPYMSAGHVATGPGRSNQISRMQVGQQSGYQMMGANQQQATVQRTNQMASNSRQMQVIQPQQAQQPGRIINTGQQQSYPGQQNIMMRNTNNMPPPFQ